MAKERSAPNARLRRAVRGFYTWLGAVVIAAAGPFIAESLIDRAGATSRIAGVVVGVLAWVPLMWVVTVMIRAGDEFVRRIHLVSMSIAFAGALLLITALDWLARAQLIAPPPLRLLWLALGVMWFVLLLVTKTWYERSP
jgi:hypothetical protein